MDTLRDLLAVFGRMHPMLLHLPIGMLIGLALMELVAWRRGAAPTSRWLLVVATLSTLLASASGWMLHEEDGYAGGFALEWHERLGIATGFAALLCCFLRFRGKDQPYRVVLMLTALLLLPAGHFGAEMTHGKGFLWEPLEEEGEEAYVPLVLESAAEEGAATLASFSEHVAPLLKARCTRCHGARKTKGELRLDSREAILAGGESGAVLASTAEDSELYRRLLLPLEHDDHMPPESKTQLAEAEIELLRLWLDAEAPFEEGFALGDGVEAPAPPGAGPSEEEADSGSDPEPVLPDLTALHDAQVHACPVEPGSHLLELSFVPIKGATDDALVARLLEPLTEHVEVLVLSNTGIRDATLDLAAGMPHLQVLQLDGTDVSDAGLAALEGHPALRELVVSRTGASPASSALFASLPQLTHLYLWGADFSAEQVDTLRRELPQVAVDFGDSFEVDPLETEADLVFTSDAPLVDPPADGGPGATAGIASLAAVNSACPVSGKPVDPRYTVVHAGKVIGFCCPNCPKTFWDDPSAYTLD